MKSALRGFFPGLLLATLLSGTLRLAGLDQVPPSLYCDEAFSAYEAYCLLETGKDSRGVALPLFFDIFGKGWGEPLYIYLTVPAVALLGLTEISARLVAALAGTLAVPVSGLMAAALMRGDEGFSQRQASLAGLSAAFLMAISPWSFHLSRVAFQASLLPLMLAGGFCLAAFGAGGPPGRVRAWLLVGAAAALGLSLYTYTVARLAMPLLVVGFVWIYRRRLRASPRSALAAGLILLLLALPITGFSLTEGGRQRFSDVSVLSHQDVRQGGPARAALAVASNYLSYHSPAFLLTQGDPNLRHSIAGHGMLHPHDLIFLAAGLATCAFMRTPGSLFLLWWLLIYPVAASLTADPRHAVRAICGQPGLYALAGVGASLLCLAPSRFKLDRRSVLSGVLILAIAAAATLSTAGYFHDYFVQYPIDSAPVWQYGLKEAYDYVESVSAGHDSIYITPQEEYPYIHLLFHQSFPPLEFQAHGLSRTRYLFDQEVYYKGSRIPNRLNPLFVMKPDEWRRLGAQAQGVEARKTIRYPGGSEAFVIAW